MKIASRRIILVLFCLIGWQTWSQEKVVTGTVTNEQGVPLPGVSVVVKNSPVGTATNFDGEFSLSIPDNDQPILVFSYLGFETNEVPVGDEDYLEVTMTEQLESLSEVVVVGYGTQDREELIGSVSQITSEDIDDRPIAQQRSAMAGQYAWVTETT